MGVVGKSRDMPRLGKDCSTQRVWTLQPEGQVQGLSSLLRVQVEDALQHVTGTMACTCLCLFCLLYLLLLSQGPVSPLFRVQLCDKLCGKHG